MKLYEYTFLKKGMDKDLTRGDDVGRKDQRKTNLLFINNPGGDLGLSNRTRWLFELTE